MHRLVLFGGGAPGLGKSTLADFLYRQLTQQGRSVQWLYEEDAAWIPAMQRFNVLWPAGDPEAIDELLAAATSLTADWMGDDAIHIVDSFVPGFFLVAGRYPVERVRRYVVDLRMVVEPLNPLLVYLTGDIRAAWERAVAHRGAAWGENSVPYVNGWPKPEYPYGSIDTIDDVIRYFEWIDRQSLSVLDAWGADVLVLDSGEPLERLETVLLDRLGLQRSAAPAPASSPVEYVGTYMRVGNEGQPTLTVNVEDGLLQVDSYWPGGAVLVPEGPDRFRLQATSRAITFERDAAGRVTALRYLIRRREYSYRRAD